MGRRVWLLVLPAVLFGALLWPAASQAFVGCTHSSGTLTVFLTEEQDGVVIARGGDAINVTTGGGTNILLACSGGVATVTNTDSVVIEEAPAARYTEVAFDLRAGPLAPGLTPEPDGTSEIEVRTEMAGRTSLLLVVGTVQSDFFHLGLDAAGAAGMNVNAGTEAVPDIDFDLDSVEIVFLFAGRGNDVVRGRGSPGFAAPSLGYPILFAGGGRGRDELIAGSSAGLFGDLGNDRLLGSRFRDQLNGGGGRDRIRAGRGNDEIDVAGEGRDTVSCGGGRKDKVVVDEKDKQGKCEIVRRPRRIGIPLPPELRSLSQEADPFSDFDGGALYRSMRGNLLRGK